MTAAEGTARWAAVEQVRQALDAICQDSLETTLARTLENREWSLKQEVSSLFVKAEDALSLLEQLAEAAERVEHDWLDAGWQHRPIAEGVMVELRTKVAAVRAGSSRSDDHGELGSTVQDALALIREALDAGCRDELSGTTTDEAARAALSRVEQELAGLREHARLAEAVHLERGQRIDALEDEAARLREERDAAREQWGAWEDSRNTNVTTAEIAIARAKSAEAECQRLRDGLRRIAENAEAWHGPEDSQPDAKHRALTVIATWARSLLSASQDTKEPADA